MDQISSVDRCCPEAGSSGPPRFRAGRWTLLVGWIWIAASAPGLSAQSAQPWSVQLSGLAASQDLGGSLIFGAGFESQLRYTPPSLWSLGAGVQWSSHTSGPDTLELSGIFLEPRYTVDIGSDRVAPYLAGRVAALRQSSTLQVAGDVSSNGGAAGAGAGLLFRASPRVNLDLGAALLWQTLEDATGAGNVQVAFESFFGYVAKAGLSIGFGSR